MLLEINSALIKMMKSWGVKVTLTKDPLPAFFTVVDDEVAYITIPSTPKDQIMFKTNERKFIDQFSAHFDAIKAERTF